MKLRKILLISLVLLIVLAFTGVALAESPKEGGTLRIGDPEDPVHLEPAQMSGMMQHRYVHLLYPSFLKYSPELDLVLDLAESYEIVDDTTIDFKLKEGIKFHHGRELVAEDVKYSIERILDPDYPSPEAFMLEAIEEVIIVDDYNVRIITEEPDAALLHGLTFGMGIYPEEKVEEYGDLRYQASGAGPFKLIEYQSDSHVFLERFEDYFGDNAYLDKVEYLIMPDDTARATALLAGDIDVARFEDPKVAESLRGQPDLNVERTTAPKIAHFHMNNRREPFDNKKVRQAMSYALDREAISNYVFMGDAEVSGPIPPSVERWAIDLSENPLYNTNHDKAKQLLEEAGYPEGFTSTIRASSGHDLAIEMAEVIREQLLEVGINLEIQLMEWGDLLDMWIEERDFDTFLIYSVTGRDPVANFDRRFDSDSPRNTSGYSNPYLDELMAEARIVVDDYEKRYDMYKEIQEIVIEDAPKLFLVSYPYYEIYRNHVKDWTIHPMAIHYHLNEVWIDQ